MDPEHQPPPLPPPWAAPDDLKGVSKRELLEFLQRAASLGFIERHGLSNPSPFVCAPPGSLSVSLRLSHRPAAPGLSGQPKSVLKRSTIPTLRAAYQVKARKRLTVRSAPWPPLATPSTRLTPPRRNRRNRCCAQDWLAADYAGGGHSSLVPQRAPSSAARDVPACGVPEPEPEPTEQADPEPDPEPEPELEQLWQPLDPTQQAEVEGRATELIKEGRKLETKHPTQKATGAKSTASSSNNLPIDNTSGFLIKSWLIRARPFHRRDSAARSCCGAAAHSAALSVRWRS